MTEDRGRMNDYTGRLSDDLTDDARGYTVGANDYAHNGETKEENKSSEDIKADIEQKRNEMGHKINMIQERLDPNRLKEQAQETVRSAVSDGADAVVEYVRDNVGGFGYAVVDTIKRNPLPAALVGIGLGWLLVKSYSSSSSDGQGNGDSDRQRYNGGRDGNGYTRYGSRYSYQAGAGQYGNEYDAPTGTQYGTGYGDKQSRYDYEASENGGQYRGNQYQRDQAAYRGGYGAGSATEGYAEQSRLGQTAPYAQDKAGNALEQARDTANQLSEQVQEKVGNVLDKARDTASQLTEQVQDTAQQTGDYVQQKVGQARDQAQQTFQQTGRQVQQTAQQNPLAFGIAALVAGALIGMALPETQMENEMLGETRDQLMDNAQSVAQDVKQRVQTIVDDKLPEVKQTVQKVADDLKETGKTAAEDLKQTLKDTGESVKQGATELAQAGKDTAKDVAQTGKEAVKDAQQSVKNSGATTDTWSTARTGSTQSTGAVTGEYRAPEEEGSAKSTKQYSPTPR